MEEMPIVTSSFAGQIEDKIRAAILERRLDPNEKLPTEEDLARRYGVSRPTVREALKRLAAQNLIRSKRGPGGGNFVNAASLEQAAPAVTAAATMLATLGDLPVEDVFGARRELEGLCLRLAIEKDDPRLEARLRAELAIQKNDATSENAFCASDVRFHRAIVDACGNVIVRLALYTVVEALMPLTNMIIASPSSRKGIMRRHERLLAAIARRDIEQASAVLIDLIAYRESEYAKVAKRG